MSVRCAHGQAYETYRLNVGVRNQYMSHMQFVQGRLLVSACLWWELGIGLVLNPISEDGCLTLELATLVAWFYLWF